MFSDEKKNSVKPDAGSASKPEKVAATVGEVAGAIKGKTAAAVGAAAKMVQTASSPANALTKNIVAPRKVSGGGTAIMKSFAGLSYPAHNFTSSNPELSKNFGSASASAGDLAKNMAASSSSSVSAAASLTGASRTGLQFTLAVSGLPPETFAVVDFSLDEAFSAPFTLRTKLVSSLQTIGFDAVLDKTATLRIWLNGALQRQVTGIIASFEQGNTGLHQTGYSMVIRPALWRTSLRRNSRIFQQETPQAIITTLLRESGVVNVAFMLRNAHPAREFCVQYQEDDLSFINRLSAEEGMYYYLDDSEKLVFADDAGTLQNGPSLPWHPDQQTSHGTLCVNAFHRSAQIRPGIVALKDYTFKNPAWPASFNKKASGQQSDYEYYDFPGRFKDEQHGRDFTRYQLEGLRNDADSGNGQSNDVRLAPGLLFTLTDHPLEELNKRWQVVHMRHSGSQPQALMQDSGEQGTVLTNQFSVVPAHQTWRPAPQPKPRIDGSQTAIVVGPPGEEIYCDEYGRVRVRFLWDRYASGDDLSSCWIRVSQPWAGEGWGMIATPRVGQEVVVEFLHGDPDQPIIIGRTYHASNLPSTRLPAAKTQMAFRSKTHKGTGYNELLFEDANGQELLSLHAQKDMKTKVKNDRTTVVDANHTETVKKDQAITVLEGNRSVNVLKGDVAEHVTEGQMTEQIAKGKSVTADSITCLATGSGEEENSGWQTSLAKNGIQLGVGKSQITLTTDSIILSIGDSVIQLTENGITINGKSVFVN